MARHARNWTHGLHSKHGVFFLVSLSSLGKPGRNVGGRFKKRLQGGTYVPLHSRDERKEV